MTKMVRCECGTEVISADDEELVRLAIDHGWRVHRMRLSRDSVMAQAEVLPRRTLEGDGERRRHRSEHDH